MLAFAPGGTSGVQWTEYEWVIGETEAPLTVLTARPGLEHESDQPVDFAFSTDATGTTFECWLDGGDPAPCTTPKRYSRLAVGEHTFHVQAVHPIVLDAQGDPLERLYTPVPTSYRFTVVDTQPPDTTVDYGPAATTNSPHAWFGFGSTEAGSIECSLDGGAWAGCESPYELTDVPVGQHTLRVRSRDLGGNVDPTPAAHSWTVSALATNTPVGSNVTVELPLPGGQTGSATFFEVSTAGATSLGRLTGGPSLPAGYGGGQYLDLHTTAGYGDPLQLCLGYDPATFVGTARILTWDGTAWIDVTLTNNPTTGVVCGIPEGLGPGRPRRWHRRLPARLDPDRSAQPDDEHHGELHLHRRPARRPGDVLDRRGAVRGLHLPEGLRAAGGG